jgi:hypothetical protein
MKLKTGQKSMERRFLAGLIIAALCSATSAHAQQTTNQGAPPPRAAKKPAVAPRAEQSQMKVCAALNLDGSIRHMLSVPPQWTFANCQAFATLFNAPNYRVGCLFTTGVSADFGGPGGSAPARNCGW